MVNIAKILYLLNKVYTPFVNYTRPNTMLEQARERTIEFQNRLTAAGIDTAIITDENTIAYLAGFWGYLSVEFGRPFCCYGQEKYPASSPH
jgi:Xaa-Pro aminopeptidase